MTGGALELKRQTQAFAIPRSTRVAGSTITAREVGIMAAYMAIMAVVCALASIIPTHCALSVEPTEALRTE